MELYRITLEHSSDTISAMCKMRSRTADNKKNTLRLLLFAICLIAGSILVPTNRAVGLLLILAGCWGLAYITNSPQRDANKVIAALKGKYPVISYIFYDNRFSVKFPAEAADVKYDQIIGLYEDKNYLYILLASTVIYILKKSESKDIEELKSFLAEKTSLKWSVPKGVLSANIYGVLRRLK